MYKFKSQLEGQIQEITFFVSLLISFSIFLSGIFYLAMSTESLTFILGTFGAAFDHALFSAFGYSFFYLAVVALHMGYVMNFHIFNFKDFKREYPVLIQSLFAHVIILSLFATLLTVFQVYLGLPSSETMSHGAGGFMGSVFGGHLYAALGIYGSLLMLLAFKSVTALVAGFFELPDVLVAVKTASKHTKHVTVKGAKTLNSSLLNGVQFFLKGNEMNEATASAGSFNKRISNSIHKANSLFTDHFHIYKHEEEPVVEKVEKKEKKEEKVVVKKAKATTANSSKLMDSLKNLKKISGFEKRKEKAVVSKKKTVAVKAKAKKK